MKRSQFNRMMLRALLLPVVVLTGLAVIFLLLIRLLLNSADWVDHSDQVLSTAHRTMGLLVDMETGLRGYMLIHDSAYLEPYKSAVPHARRAFTRLGGLVADNPQQDAAVRVLSQRYEGWHLTTTEMLAHAIPGSPSDPNLQLREQAEMDQIRAGFAEFISAEEQLRTGRENHVRHITIFAALASMVTVLLIGFLVSLSTRRTLRELSETYTSAIQDSEKEQRRSEEGERRAQFLADASNRLASSLDYDIILKMLVTLPLPDFADWSAVDIVRIDSGIERVAAAHTDPKLAPAVMQLSLSHRISATDNTLEAVTRSGKAQLVENISEERLTRLFQEPELSMVKMLSPRCLIVAPIRGHHAVHGALTLVSSTEGRYRASDLPFVEDLGRRAGLAIENARLYREASASNRAKDEFLATLSHELRTPLTSVVGWSSLLRAGGLDDATRDVAVDTIFRSANLQAEMIEELLDLSRIDSGKLDLELEDVNFPKLVAEVIDSLRPAADAKRIRMELTTRAELIVHGDNRRLRQIVWNLLSNATKFTPAQGMISVSTQLEGSSVRLTVEDDGIGLDSVALLHIWERFWQADGRASREHGGLGLGLAVVRNLVELHGGSVSAASRGKGLGSIFTVDFPSVSRSVIGRSGPSGAGIRLDDVRALLVDDELEARTMLTAALNQYGAVVQTASSVAEALTVLAHWQPTIVISDIGMPGEDGYSLINRIRSSSSTADASLPAIALTAYARPEDRDRTLSAGFNLHLAKPIDPVVLARAVLEALEQQPEKG